MERIPIDDSNTIRLRLIEAVRHTLIGPNIGGPLVEYLAEHHPEFKLDPATDEILVSGTHDSPPSAYKSGKLHQRGRVIKPDEENPSDGQGEVVDEQQGMERTGKITKSGAQEDSDSDEEIKAVDPLSEANEQEQSSMGFTFRVSRHTKLKIFHQAAIYRKQEMPLPVYNSRNGEYERAKDNEGNDKSTPYWWKREAIKAKWEPEPDLKELKNKRMIKFSVITGDLSSIEFWLTRRSAYGESLILTLSVVNTGKEVLYQNELALSTPDGKVLPYETLLHPGADEDRQLMDLLYRDHTIHGIGHGCSVNWSKDNDGKVRAIRSEFLPVHSLPPVQPFKGDPELDLAMYVMSQKDKTDKWAKTKDLLEALTAQYEDWIKGLKVDLAKLDIRYKKAADTNITECNKALNRMKAGIQLLDRDADARTCFCYMNEAMLWQQQRSKTDQRKWLPNGKLEPLKGAAVDGKFKDLHTFQDTVNPNTKEKDKGRWRPFQLAFVLMNLRSIWEPDVAKEELDADGKKLITPKEEREMVDLIWFPTGGGKTEAYLGLTAFTIFARRLRNDEEHQGGTTVLMRYTLRLLTTQQFERAASLILGCDQVRVDDGNLGEEVSIGLWVGRDNTPNTNEDAITAYDQIGYKYKFNIRKCPCCGAQIGPSAAGVKGLVIVNEEVRFRCANPDCEYHNADQLPNADLPVYVVDEQVYDHTPTLVIGTVDKFASIPWKSQAGGIKDGKEAVSKLFGFRGGVAEGVSRIKPPELIIQDELHLIAGPLGSMVGMYETLVQELCTDWKKHKHPFYPSEGELGTRPKIVASSATITRAGDQVLALYGTKNLQIFPPQGLDIGETRHVEQRSSGGARRRGRHMDMPQQPSMQPCGPKTGLGHIEVALVRIKA